MSNCNNCKHINGHSNVHPIAYCWMYNKDVTFSVMPKNCPKFEEDKMRTRESFDKSKMKRPTPKQVRQVIERADALTALSKKNETLREEIKELYFILGLMHSRAEYVEAEKLWYKDTKQKGYVIPDLGGHWGWALKYIKIGMEVVKMKDCIIDGCKHCGECNIITKILGGENERKRLHKKA